jgi:ADP-heptose:LPS heptosyltransferase
MPFVNVSHNRFIMNTAQMRVIDDFLGGAICLLLDSYAIVRRLFHRQELPESVRKILVTKYLGMGSILLATPTIRTLKEAYPDSKLVFLTFERNAAFARQIPLIDEVRSVRTTSVLALARDLARLLPALRRERFDLVLDLEFFARFSTIVSFLSGGGMRIGYYLPKLWRGDLLTHQIHFNPYRHVTEVFASQLAPLGLAVTDYSLTPPTVIDAALARVTALLDSYGVAPGEKLIVVNANASDLSRERCWPIEYFVSLITSAAELPGRRLILVGSSDETTYVDRLHNSLPGHIRTGVLNIAGKLAIDEFIALLKSVDLCISNDSGPLHIAASLGIPTVSFFGPETPSLYGPVGSSHTVFNAGLYCSPCLNVFNAKRAMCNGDNRCMKDISPESVLATLLDKGIL